MMNYPPRPYTQKLLNMGLIKFFENDKIEHDGIVTKLVVYIPEDDYIMLSNGSLVAFFYEHYIYDRFKKFSVEFYTNDWDGEDVEDSEQLIFYKKEFIW
jgi:hypothetical protein